MLASAERFMTSVLENIGASSRFGANYIISDDSGVLPAVAAGRYLSAAMLSRPLPADALPASAFICEGEMYVTISHHDESLNNRVVKVNGSSGKLLKNVQTQSGRIAGTGISGTVYYGYLTLKNIGGKPYAEALLRSMDSAHDKYILFPDGQLIGVSEKSICVWSVPCIPNTHTEKSAPSEHNATMDLVSSGELSHRMGDVSTFFFCGTERGSSVVMCLAKKGMFVLSPTKSTLQSIVELIVGEREANYVRRMEYPGILTIEEYIPIVLVRKNREWLALSKVRTKMRGGNTVLKDQSVKALLSGDLKDVPRDSVRRMFIYRD